MEEHRRTRSRPLGDGKTRRDLQPPVTRRHPEPVQGLCTAPTKKPRAPKRDPRKLGAHAVRGCARGREGPRALLQRSEVARYDDERAAASVGSQIKLENTPANFLQ